MSSDQKSEHAKLYELIPRLCRPANAHQISKNSEKVSRPVLQLLATKPEWKERALIPIVGIRVAREHTQLGEDKGSSRHTK